MAEEVKKDDKRDDKKEGDKEEKKETSALTPEALILIIALLLALVGRLGQIGLGGLLGEQGFSFTMLFTRIVNALPEWLVDIVRKFALAYVTFATLASLFFLAGIVYALIKWRYYAVEWHKQLYPSLEAMEPTPMNNSKWQRVLDHIGSDNPSDWRLAILEADIILDELLDDLGYVGDTIGDKLKKANKGDFKTLDIAWEAHRIRNAIAHEGQDFILTQREARRIIGLYEQVFREFDFIEDYPENLVSEQPTGEDISGDL